MGAIPILTSKVRLSRAAQFSVTSRCSKMQILANRSSVAVSDLRSHFFLNHEVAPVHQAATGQGIFRFQREETTRYRLNSLENFTAAACIETRNSFATPRMWHGRRSDENRAVGARRSAEEILPQTYCKASPLFHPETRRVGSPFRRYRTRCESLIPPFFAVRMKMTWTRDHRPVHELTHF